MNDELNKRLIEALDSMTKWTGEQVPLAAQEVIDWTFFSSVLNGAFFVVLAIVSALVFRKLWAASKASDEKEEKECGYSLGNPMQEIGSIMFALIFVGACIKVLACASDAIKCKVAPRVVVIEAVRGYSR